MGQILVWECEETGALFRDEAAYRKHKKKIAKEHATLAREQRERDEQTAALQPLYACKTFTEIEQWLVEHWPLVRQFSRESIFANRDKGRLVGAQFYHMRYGEQSCSHSAPRGKPTNWCGRNDPLPKTYLGWHGRVRLLYDAAGDYECLQAIGICTGTGSGSSNAGRYHDPELPWKYKFSADVTLWADDFPNLQRGKVLESSTFGDRDDIGILHDIMHFDRADVYYRAKKWLDFLQDFKQVNPHASTPYHPLIVPSDSAETEANFASRAFGQSSFPYFVVDRNLHYSVSSRIERNCRLGCTDFQILGRSVGMRSFLAKDVEMMIEWKMKGLLSPEAQIVDLKARRERLEAEGLL